MDDKTTKDTEQLFDSSLLGFAPPIKRRNRPNLCFPVAFDPSCPDLEGELSDEELACVFIYVKYFEANGKLPPSQTFRSILRAGFKRFGLDDSVLTNDYVDSHLFKDLFLYDPNKKLGDAIRRLVGFPNSESSVEECAHAIKFASELLTLRHNSPVPILPTTGDIKRAIVAQIIVPELGSPMPSPETIVRKLSCKSWKEAVKIALNIDEAQARDQLNSKIELEDLMQDYKAAFKYFNGDTFEGDDRFLTYDQLDQFREELGGLGYRRYTNFIRKAVDAGIYININDLRRHAQLPINQVTDNRRTRRTQELWSKQQIVDGYMAAWEHFGLQNDPPTHAQLVEISLLQTDAINSAGKLDSAIAHARSIPEVRVPSQKAIESHFYSLTRLLGHLEHEDKVPMDIISDNRLGRMASVSLEKVRDPRELPTCVANRMMEMTIGTRMPQDSFAR